MQSTNCAYKKCAQNVLTCMLFAPRTSFQSGRINSLGTRKKNTFWKVSLPGLMHFLLYLSWLALISSGVKHAAGRGDSTWMASALQSSPVLIKHIKLWNAVKLQHLFQRESADASCISDFERLPLVIISAKGHRYWQPFLGQAAAF